MEAKRQKSLIGYTPEEVELARARVSQLLVGLKTDQFPSAYAGLHRGLLPRLPGSLSKTFQLDSIQLSQFQTSLVELFQQCLSEEPVHLPGVPRGRLMWKFPILGPAEVEAVISKWGLIDGQEKTWQQVVRGPAQHLPRSPYLLHHATTKLRHHLAHGQLKDFYPLHT